MAEFGFVGVQEIQPNQPVPMITIIPCRKGYVYHRESSGILTLRGIVNNPCANFARYRVTFNGNVAIPEDGTVAPIAVAIAIDGEPVGTSKAIVTPAAVDEYFNVTSTAIITIPSGCCMNVSVENVSEGDGATPAPSINVQNSNLVVSRIA